MASTLPYNESSPKLCFRPSSNVTIENDGIWGSSAVLLADYTLTGPLLTCVVCFGVAGNIACSLIFSRRYKKFKIYLFLLVLAIWDLALIAGTLFVFGIPTLLYGKIVLYGQYAPLYPFVYFFCNVARNGSVWIVIVIAVERYFALCYPYQFEAFDTHRRSNILLILVSFSAFLYGIPRFFELYVDQCWNPIIESFVPEVLPTSLRLNRTYWLLYRVAGGFMFYSAGPFFVLIVLTIRISVEIRKGVPVTPRKTSDKDETHSFNSKSHLAKKPSTQDKSESINHWMHVAVITKFLICHSLPTILDIYTLMDTTHFLRTDAGMLLGHFSNFLVLMNSSCNFFVYLVTSAHFKKDLKKCIAGKKERSDIYSAL